MFSKMNAGQPASNWRVPQESRGNEGRITDGGKRSKNAGGGN